MSKYKGIIITLFSLCAMTLCGAYTASAATSDAVSEQLVSNYASAKYGASYEAPCVVPEGNVDTSSGAVNIREVDVSLPGKNGLDVNIYREFSSYDPDYGYMFDVYDDSRQDIPRYLGVPYTYMLDGKTSSIYIAYNYENEIKDFGYVDKRNLENPSTDSRYDDRYLLKGVLKNSGDIKLTWDKSKPPVRLYHKMSEYHDRNKINNNVSLGNGWHVIIPHIASVSFYTSKSTDYENLIKHYNEVVFEDGKTERLKYSYRSNKAASGLDYDELESYNIKNNDGRYNVEMFIDAVEDSRGFKYNIKISTLEGKNYYFYTRNFKWKSNADITAIDDKYGNCILYENANGVWTITDTYGRKISVSSGGITVTAGGAVKKIDYVKETIRDTAADPNGYYHIFNTHKLKVIKYTGANGSGASEQTMYTMKPLCIKRSDQSVDIYNDYVTVLTSIKYPTNAYREYTYEEKPDAPQYYYEGGSVSSNYGDLFFYKVTGESLYENGALVSSAKFSYSGLWTLSKYVSANLSCSKKFESTETFADGQVNTATTKYDRFGRIIAEETKYNGGADNKQHTEEKTYNYKNPGYSDRSCCTPKEERLTRNAPLINTLTYLDGILISSVDTVTDMRSRLPLRTRVGEKETKYTYDTAYYVPLTITETRLNAPDVKRVNTLTADKKSVAETKIYDGTTLKETISYTYNTDGTLASQTVHNDSGDIKTEYLYYYIYDCMYFVYEYISDLEDADGTSKESQLSEVGHDPFGRKNYEGCGNSSIDYEYDMLDRLTKQINPDNTFKTYSYDIPNNTVTETDERGYTTTKAYTPLGKLKKIYLDGSTSKTVGEYTYDVQGRLTSETSYTDIGGTAVTSEYTYDSLGRVLTKTDKEGKKVLDVATNTYATDEGTIIKSSSNKTVDVSGYKRAEVIFHNMDCTKYYTGWRTVSLDGKKVVDDTFTHQGGDTMTFDLTNVNEISFGAASSSYGVTLRLLENDSERETVGGASLITTTTYKGDQTYVKPTTVTETDGYGNVIREEFYKGTVAEANLLNKNIYAYDYNNNIVKTRGGRTYMENLGEYTTKTEYDYAGRPLKEYRADGEYIQKTYDAAGNMLTVTDYMGKTTEYTYDKLGRVIKTATPFTGTHKAETLTYYDIKGNIIKTKQQNNKAASVNKTYAVTEMEYDRCNRVTAVKQNDGTKNIYTQYAYDNSGNMIKKVTGQTSKLSSLNGTLPSRAAAETYEYDRFGNVTKHTDAEGNVETAEYNLIGLAKKKTDRNGDSISYTYNAYGSPTCMGAKDVYILSVYSANNLPTWSFDQKNDISVTCSMWNYDDYGYVNLEEKLYGDCIAEYTNDVNGNRKTMILKDNQSNTAIMTASYTYDNLDRLTGISCDNGAASVSYEYDKNGRVIKETTAGNTTKYTYNDAGLPIRMYNSNGYDYITDYYINGNKWYEYGDLNGLIFGSDYKYDNLGRLTQEDLTCASVSDVINYTYDTRGNRISKAGKNNTTVYTYNKNNRLTSENLNSGAAVNTYTYDKNGNMLSRIKSKTDADEANTPLFGGSTDGGTLSLAQAGGGQSTDTDAWTTLYTYDCLNRLTTIETDSGHRTDYVYNAENRRCLKTVDGVTTKQIWDNDSVIMDRDSDRNILASYYRGAGIFAAKTPNGTAEYYVRDPHGSTVRTVKADGTTVAEYEYDAFGNQLTNTDTDNANPFLYCGEYYDEETGLIYLRNRYYDPSTGRFITEDPHWDANNMIYGDKGSIPDTSAIMQSGNLYVYCTNNPVNYWDPLGLDVYYFVNSEFKKEAEKDKKKLEKIYKEPVHILETDSREALINEWNKMGNWNGENVDVSLVVFNMHGSPQSLSPHSDSSTGSIRASDMENGTLISKNVGNILVLGCNSGHFDHRYSSLVNKLLVHNNVDSVIASDGTVTNRSIFGKYKSKGDKQFVRHLWSKKKYRDNYGFIKYTKNNNGELEWNILGDKFNIKSVLNKANIK